MQSRVVAAVEAFASTGAGHVEKMKNGSGHKIRVGSWRVGLEVAVREGRLTVTWVEKRGDVY